MNIGNMAEKAAEKTAPKGVKNKIVSAAWQLFHDKGYNHTTVDDIIELSGTSKGSFYYYFNTKDELLNTLSVILDDYYEELEGKMNPGMNSFVKLLFLNVEVHSMMEEKISIDLLASLYSTQLVTQGNSYLLDQNRKYYRLIHKIVEEGQKRGQIRDDKPIGEIVKYYSMCERALISDWCMNKGSYSLAQYSRECMPIMLEYFKA
ncbi:HTH-type transcriptional repressor KstR2 [uncultured Clostridium sp.]|nr:HTH-type transcriptional repressor KstR2 [uncultured Clostridium sp.]